MKGALQTDFWFTSKVGNRLLSTLALLGLGVVLTTAAASATAVSWLWLLAFIALFVGWRVFDRVEDKGLYWIVYGLIHAGFALLFIASFVWACVLGVLALLFFNGMIKTRPGQKRVVQGRSLSSLAATRRHYRAMSKGHAGPTLLWGGVQIPEFEASTHFLVIGASGSGKTVTLRLLMQSVLPLIQPGSHRRAMIYDAKRDVLSLLKGMGVTCPIAILNPFDARCTAWDMAADITTYSDVEALAHILIPKDSDKEDEFFRSSAIEILKGVVQCFIDYAPGVWTLRDIVVAMRSRKILQALLAHHEESEHLLEFFESEKTAANIMATIATKMGRYRTIAALWARAENRVSLEQWVNGEFILVLGKDNKAEVALDALNQLLVTRAAQMMLDKPEVKAPHTYLFLDELPSLGKTTKLLPLATEGRSKGVCLAAGFQSLEHLKHIYGEQVTHTITGQFRHKAILRLDDEPTAEWSSKLLGDAEIVRLTESESRSSSWSAQGFGKPGTFSRSRSRSVSEQYQVQRTVFASQFMSIPPINRQTGQGLTGYYLGQKAYTHTYSLGFIKANLLPKADESDFLPVAAEFQRLRSWSDCDWDRLEIRNIMQADQSTKLPEQDQTVTTTATDVPEPPLIPPELMAPDIDWEAYQERLTPPPGHDTGDGVAANEDEQEIEPLL